VDVPRNRGRHTGPRGRATPPRRAYRAQVTCHGPTTATQDPGHRTRPHRSHTGHTGLATPPPWPYGDKGRITSPRRPYVHQWTGNALTAAIRCSGDGPRPHGGRKGPRVPATYPRRPYKAQGTYHAPTTLYWAQVTGHATTTAIRGPGNRPRPHGGHTGTR